MGIQSDPLKNLRVASPCHLDWDRMTGDERVRFCQSCNLHVYNFSEMTSKEIVELIAKTEGRLCGRMYRRTDGTVITSDCPVGLKAVRQRVARVAGAVFATLLSFGAMAFGQAKRDGNIQSVQVVDLRFQIKNDASRKGTLIGFVFDSTRAAVVGAHVTLVNKTTRAERVTQVDDSGTFSFTELVDAEYALKIEAAGFQKLDIETLELKADDGYEMTIFLRQLIPFLGLISLPEAIQSPDINVITNPGAVKLVKPIKQRQ